MTTLITTLLFATAFSSKGNDLNRTQNFEIFSSCEDIIPENEDELFKMYEMLQPETVENIMMPESENNACENSVESQNEEIPEDWNLIEEPSPEGWEITLENTSEPSAERVATEPIAEFQQNETTKDYVVLQEKTLAGLTEDAIKSIPAKSQQMNQVNYIPHMPSHECGDAPRVIKPPNAVNTPRVIMPPNTVHTPWYGNNVMYSEVGFYNTFMFDFDNALQIAVTNGNEEFVCHILGTATLGTKKHWGAQSAHIVDIETLRFALDHAAAYGKTNIVRMILKFWSISVGSKFQQFRFSDVMDEMLTRALDMASKNGEEKTVRMILDEYKDQISEKRKEKSLRAMFSKLLS